MFTGLIEEVGTMKELVTEGGIQKLTVDCHQVLEGTKIGDSIAVNGICVTITSLGSNHFTADVMQETIQKTHLSFCKPGTKLNLERALVFGERLGGHLVQGHVDGVGTITECVPVGEDMVFRFHAPPELLRAMIPKGSVAINGVSLTIVDVQSDSFLVSLIPHTLKMTHFHASKPGDRVNIECDMMGRYITRWLEVHYNKR